MNQQILMLVLVVVVIGVISAGVMMSNSPETYTAASDFSPSKDIYMPGMKADGTIVLTHKFKDIDTAIDQAAGKIKTDYLANDAIVDAGTKGYTDAKLAQNGGYVTMNALGGQLTSWMNNSFDKRYAMKNHKHDSLFSWANPKDAWKFRLVMQADNNLVIYRPDGTVAWSRR